MTMEKFKKRFNTSPLIKKKGITTNGSPPNSGLRGDGSGALLKTFGASLEELTLRERSDVPLIVRKICEYISERGLGIEGLFRINGNVRLIQNLKASYETEGDVDLSECNDIHSIAGLLKRFVRDLSDGLIPENFTIDFIKTIEANCDSVETSLSEIKKLIDCLPPEAYATLRYLCFFLWEVSQKEAENKMSAGSLGIVFGPNVFRCSENSINVGLSLSYTHCNRAMSLMITYCHRLFDKPDLPTSPGLTQTSSPSSRNSLKASPPPRPPPPVIASSPDVPRLVVPTMWGRQSADDQALSARSDSPFLPDTSEADNSAYRDTASVLPAPAVSNVISHVVSDSLFGDLDASGIDAVTEPSPKPRKRRVNEAITPRAVDGAVGYDPDHEVTDLFSPGAALLSPREYEDEAENLPAAPPRRSRKPRVTPRRASPPGRELNNNLESVELITSLSDKKLAETPSENEHSFGEGRKTRRRRKIMARFPRETEQDKTAAMVLDIRRQIQSLKRNVRRFEEDYARVNGRKPTVREKNSDKTMRVCLSDLALCRQKLRALQEGLDEPAPLLRTSARSKSAEHLHVNGTRQLTQTFTQFLSPRSPRQPRLSARESGYGDPEETSLENGLSGSLSHQGEMKTALANLEHELQVKRELAGRPEDLNTMTWDEIREEKVTLQRALLNYETSHGRPSTLEEKEVMRPIYDRYRTVKRILVNGRRGPMTKSMIGTTSTLSADEAAPNDLFAVTQDFQARVRREGLMGISLTSAPAANRSSPQTKQKVVLREGDRRAREQRRSQPVMPSNTLEMSSIEHLQEEENRLLTEKKRLQRLLKQFEREFEHANGRKVGREDREPMHNEYLNYKRIKMKLKDLGNTISMYS